MPGTFDYECLECGEEFEYTVDFLSERDNVKCRCGGATKRLLSPPKSFTIWANDRDPSGGQFGGPREYERALSRKDATVVAMGDASIDEMHKWGERLRKEQKERERKERQGAIDKMMTDLGDDLYKTG